MRLHHLLHYLLHLTKPANIWFAMVIAVTSPLFHAKSQAQIDDALAIMEKVSHRDLGLNSIANFLLIITDKKGQQKERWYRAFGKTIPTGRKDLTLVERPKKLLNTGFLSIDHRYDEPQDRQWLYLPALKRTKRIATKNKKNRFMASDFSYHDMTLLNTRQSRYKILEQAKIEGVNVWKISVTPINEQVVKTSGYRSSLFWVRRNPYLIVRAEHQLENTARKKIYQAHEYKQIEGIWVVTASEMQTFYQGELTQKSQLWVKAIQFNQDVDDNMFTQRRLEQGL